jgi:L(+)-tartrate dehydratase beta subunit
VKKIIQMPLCENTAASLRIGDIVYFSGLLATARDEVYRRVVQEGIMPKADLSGMAIIHAGPIVRKADLPELYELISFGPTSSIRMEKWAYEFLEKTGIKIMIGKGGMGEKSTEACRKFGAIHCIFPGGCAVLGALQIEKIEGVFWQELGMAECIWVMKAREFGPLIVSIDSHGNNLFTENSAYYLSRREKIVDI